MAAASEVMLMSAAIIKVPRGPSHTALYRFRALKSLRCAPAGARFEGIANGASGLTVPVSRRGLHRRFQAAL